MSEYEIPQNRTGSHFAENEKDETFSMTGGKGSSEKNRNKMKKTETR
jgi:hypothetical protein